MNYFVKRLAIAALPVILLTSGTAHSQETGAPPEPTQLGSAQTINAETPEAVAQRYMETVRRSDWNASAELMHPDALRQLKTMFRPIVVAGARQNVGKMFFNVNTVAEFDRLSGKEAFARLMRGLVKMSPETSAALKTSTSDILGHVLEAPDVAHVVYRMKIVTQGITVTKVTVMPLRQSPSGWRGLLTGDIENLAQALGRMNAAKMVTKPTPKALPKKPAPKR
ncbi:MAG TPA: hypothetical protein VF719_07305 [Abditibacteriaceae bacterium]|jgi:hypothetical protein